MHTAVAIKYIQLDIWSKEKYTLLLDVESSDCAETHLHEFNGELLVE